MTNLKFNWYKAYKDMEQTKSTFPSGTSLKTNFDGFEWLAEEIEPEFRIETLEPIPKSQRINKYLVEE